MGVSTFTHGLEVLVGATINGVGYGTLVGIEENKKNPLNNFMLYQNYPNPFNPTTNIEFELRKNTKVELAIFDVQGKLVSRLLNEKKTAGKHSINFDAGNFATGIYIYNLKKDNFSTSKKMLLFK